MAKRTAIKRFGPHRMGSKTQAKRFDKGHKRMRGRRGMRVS